MLHSIKKEELGPLGPAMTRAVETCVHCGFCLAACPTYRELGQEMDSPRGRIVLMKEVLEGTLPLKSVQPHVDRCLGCLACEPACPSGVPYRDLISPFRAWSGIQPPTPAARWRRRLMSWTLPYPRRFRMVLRLGRLGKRLAGWMPAPLRPLLALLPESIPSAWNPPRISPAVGARRARVALLTGCAQQVLDPDITRATVEVLTRNGVEVVIPEEQGCCGGLAWHTGDWQQARAFAQRNVKAFPEDVDAIVTNAAGCGSALHEAALILAGTPWEEKAATFAGRVQDVSAFLSRLGWNKAFGRVTPVTVVYQDACHLRHAQGVELQPRQLLQSIPGLALMEPADAHLCCGSAGTYNIDQPAIAASLGRQKAIALAATGARIAVTGNIGCMTQLQVHLKAIQSEIRVRHTMQLLRNAYTGRPLDH